jgi:hypothetical protein
MFHGGYAPEIVMLMAGQEESTFPLLNLVKSNISDIHDFSYAGHIDYNFDYYGPVYRTAAEQPEQFCGQPSLETGYSVSRGSVRYLVWQPLQFVGPLFIWM